LNFKVRIFHQKNPKRTHYFIVCHGKDTDKFLAFVKKNAPYIPKSMTYKMGEFDKRNKKYIEKKRKLYRNRLKFYYQDNKEKIQKIQSKYFQKNKKKILSKAKIRWHEYTKEYRRKNKRYREYMEKYRAENKDSLNEKSRIRYWKDRK
jgi:hypothetical protein